MWAFFILYLMMPLLIAINFGIYMWNSDLWSEPKGCVCRCKDCVKFLTCTIPSVFWLTLFFGDGRYVACLITPLQKDHVESSELRPWEWCDKQRVLTDEQKRTKESFYISKITVFSFICFILLFALIYQSIRYSKAYWKGCCGGCCDACCEECPAWKEKEENPDKSSAHSTDERDALPSDKSSAQSTDKPNFGVYMWKSSLCTDSRQQSGCECSSNCCVNFLTCTIPSVFWLVLFFGDGRYVACLITKLKKDHVDSSELPPWEWCDKPRILTDDQNQAKEAFYISKVVVFSFISFILFVALIYQCVQCCKDQGAVTQPTNTSAAVSSSMAAAQPAAGDGNANV
ncbi:hypothetical protein AOLI_G00202110 [Acnodon oligacanthus]